MSVLLHSAIAVFLFPCIAHRQQVKSVIETGIEYNDNQSSVTSKSINEMVMQTVERACIDQMAQAFEQILKDNAPDSLTLPETCSTEKGATSLECKPLAEILKHRWNTEDEIAEQTMSFQKQRLTALTNMIRQRGFSVNGARLHCRKHAAEPRPEAVKDCLLKHVTEGNTAMTRKQRFSRSMSWTKTKTLKMNFGGASASSNLKGFILKRFDLEHQLDVLANCAKKQKNDVLLAGQIKSISRQMNNDKKLVKTHIKRTKFSYHHSLQQCLKECVTDTLSNSASMLARIEDELCGPVIINTDEECHEKEKFYCPEGTAADMRRNFDPIKFAAVWAGTFAVYKPTAMAIGGVVGFLVGGPVGAAGFIAAAAFPGPGFVVPIPIAMAASTDWFPSCRCFPVDCEFDHELGYCMMAATNAAKNPFARLPYPGQRCVLKGPFHHKQCELAPCTEAHYARELHGYQGGNLSGMIDRQAGSHNVNNCLRVNGDVPQQILSAAMIPVDAGSKNSAASRTALYEELGATFELDYRFSSAGGKSLGT